MSYCTVDDVRALLTHRTIDDESEPSETNAEAFCANVTDEMNGRIRQHGYTVPVTDAEALKVLRVIAARGAAYAFECSASTDVTQELPGAVKGYGTRYDKDLADLAADRIALGAIATPSTPRGNPDLAAGGVDEVPRIRRDMRF